MGSRKFFSGKGFKMEGTFDLVIVLGAHVGRNESGKWDLAPHTRMRTQAATIAAKKGVARHILLTGGFNVGVRYGEWLSEDIYNQANRDPNRRKPDFSAEAKVKARAYVSEAQVMEDHMWSVPNNMITREENSSTTEENAKFCIAKALGINPRLKTVAVLTQLYHHRDGAIRLFTDEFSKIGITPADLYAEDLLVCDDPEECIPMICEYYSKPKGSKPRLQYDVKDMKRKMVSGESVRDTNAVQLS